MLVTISFGYRIGLQSQYSGYKDHRIEGENIGFAVHCYPAGMEVMPNRTVVKEMAPLQEGDMNLSNVVGTSK